MRPVEDGHGALTQSKSSLGRGASPRADDGERFAVPGRRGRRLKVTRYATGWSLDVAIILPGQPKARAAITLDANEVRQLAARFDAIADDMERLREACNDDQAPAA